MYTAFQKDNVHYDQNWGRPVHSLLKSQQNMVLSKQLDSHCLPLKVLNVFKLFVLKENINATWNNWKYKTFAHFLIHNKVSQHLKNIKTIPFNIGIT